MGLVFDKQGLNDRKTEEPNGDGRLSRWEKIGQSVYRPLDAGPTTCQHLPDLTALGSTDTELQDIRCCTHTNQHIFIISY
ncbi:MAG: hypothetical protein EA359_17560 [Balneolaceae bacterium]|nr:MAG: hypothetical protein EA359_17560 [Balneolaceae bacterium]